jgi:hypothetical protein
MNIPAKRMWRWVSQPAITNPTEASTIENNKKDER